MARPAIVNDLKNLHLSRACLFLLHFRALDICSQFLGVPDIWLEIIFKIFLDIVFVVLRICKTANGSLRESTKNK